MSDATPAEKLPPPVLGSYNDPSSPIASTTLTRRKVNTLTPSYTTDVKKTPTSEEGILLTRNLDQAFVDENTCLPQPGSRLSRRSSHLTEGSTTSLTGASAGRSAGVVAKLFSPVTGIKKYRKPSRKRKVLVRCHQKFLQIMTTDLDTFLQDELVPYLK